MIGKNLNEYEVREEEVEQLIGGRLVNSEQRKEWSYEQEVRDSLDSRNKTKYQDVEMTHKVPFLEDMQQIIYDPRLSKEDDFFSPNSNWKMVGFEQIQVNSLNAVPSAACMRVSGNSGVEVETYWGRLEMEGRIYAKINQTSYAPMMFNLRRRVITFYPISEAETQTKESLLIQLTETTFNNQSETQEYFGLKMGEKTLRIRKDNESREAIRAIQRCLFRVSFLGAYCLRNEVPSAFMADYANGEIDTIRGVDFVHEQHIKDIVGSRYYRQAIGGFLYLLNKESSRRKTLSGQITFPRWLKTSFKSIPAFEVSLVTNVVPPKMGLMDLKIKVHQSEIPLLNQNLKYIFPFYKNYVQRTLIVYQSNLTDEQVNYMMKQISYPMHTIGLPKNHLSLLGLEKVLNAANTLYHEVVDCSYNSKLVSVSGNKLFSLANANPSLKKLVLRGCYVLLGEEEEFFQGLSNNMCLQHFQLDYMDNYNQSMIRYLTNYDATIS